ncbi:sulfatase-like hydrolase/transferase [Alienimonas chondri]|uniref:sulfatase-like hydrolase/transferase n=1 Tax=Alienimonas chondri TaxID=2681879 RepID=UPI0019D5097F|nr:sulfatase-like hydrolase/transferase [Alienimonas chondri]
MIFTDDHGYADLGVQGVRDDVRTPHIDALAARGVRFADGYVTAPQCVPSRAGILTGRYQNRFGLESNPDAADAGVMQRFRQQQTLPERLRDRGYVTGMAGKWHLGPPPQISGHGFDHVFLKQSNGAGFWSMNLDGEDVPPSLHQGGGYHLELIADFACAFIDRHHEKPFFFYLAPRAPHVPLDAPKRLLDRFPGEMPERRRQALAMISAVDDGVGRIVETLRKHDLERQTLIFVIGDNGAPLKMHMLDAPGGGPGWDGSLNTPMNGEKGMLTEGGVRVPFVAAWPGVIPGGQTSSDPVISLDVAATALALAGTPRDEALDGVDLLPRLTGEPPSAPPRALYWRWLDQSAIRKGRWKYLRGGGREYLFDLVADPEEKHNRLADRPEQAAQLFGELRAWSRELSPPGIGALKSEAMRSQGVKFYDWYLEGIRDPVPPPAANRKPRRPNPAGDGGRR